jgi:hypothetical protein
LLIGSIGAIGSIDYSIGAIGSIDYSLSWKKTFFYFGSLYPVLFSILCFGLKAGLERTRGFKVLNDEQEDCLREDKNDSLS